MATAQDEIDRLYGLPLDEFTPARDAVAKRLRAEGDRAGAEEVKRQRKPSVAAWALNQLRRREQARVGQLLEAGARLQQAQAQLLSGGERGVMREAAAEERELVGQLVDDAERVLAEAGHPAGPTLQNRVRETLHAAAGNSEARELLDRGRLVRDYQMSDLGLPGAAALGAPSISASTPGPAAAPKPDAARRRKADALRRRIADAQAKQKDLAERARADEDAAQQAGHALRAAEEAHERALAAAQRARARADDARGRVDELQAELQELA
jgi:hypothetical protein